MDSQGSVLGESDELVHLESQDANLHKQMVDTLDSIIYQSIYSKLQEEFPEGKDTENEMELIDEAIRREMADMKDFDPIVLSSTTGEQDWDKLERYLQNMAKIRNQIVEQQLISDAYDENEFDRGLLEEKNLASQSKLSNVENMTDNLHKLKEVTKANREKLEKVRELVRKQRELRGRIRNVEGVEDYITEEELADIKQRYKKIVGKNLMLGHFITDLIAALNSANVATDERLLQILMDCGDYSDYDLLYD